MPIAFERVAFSYDGKSEVLAPFDLVVEDGEFLGIIGHTGSGKSTLIQLMNALLIPSAGRVLVDDMDTRERKLRREIRTRVGVAFQYPETQLFANTVADDIAFGPRNLGLDDREVDARVRCALESLGLQYDEVARKSPFDLSGGQQRRVALAGVLAMEPRALVLDEPAAGMDPATACEMRGHLRALNETGMTVVLVSHSMEEIAELCSRVIVLEHGSIHMSGSPEELFCTQNAAELRRINLGLPRATKFALELEAKGLELTGSILNEEQLVEALMKKVTARGGDIL